MSSDNPYEHACKRCGKSRFLHHDLIDESGQRVSVCPTAVFEYEDGQAMSPEAPHEEQMCTGCSHARVWHVPAPTQCRFANCPCRSFKA